MKLEDTAMIDRFYAKKLWVTRMGEQVEVVGFTEGIRTFTTSPLVFASFKNALKYVQ